MVYSLFIACFDAKTILLFLSESKLFKILELSPHKCMLKRLPHFTGIKRSVWYSYIK